MIFNLFKNIWYVAGDARAHRGRSVDSTRTSDARMRPLRTVLFVLAVLAPTATAQTPVPRPAVVEFTLDNGMTFLVVEQRQAPVVTFYTYADVGSVDEPNGKSGIAHMFEHMAFKGTTSLGSRAIGREVEALAAEEAAYLALREAQQAGAPDPETARLSERFVALRDSAKRFVEDAAFDALISRNGGVGMNASTSADRTDYFYSLPSNKVELWFATESDRFANPVLREFYQERDVVMEERRLRTESNPTGRLIEEFLAAAFKAHPYGQPVIGHLSDLQSLSRTDALAFFERYYHAGNLTVAIVGDVDAVQVRRLAETYFAPLRGGAPPEPVRTVEPVQLAERRVTLVEQAQPVVLHGYHRPSGSHPDDPAYTVLVDVLGRGRTSRLHRALEDTGDALFAGAFTPFPGSKYPGLVIVQAVPNRGVDVDSLDAAVTKVLATLAAEGPTDAELQRAKIRARADLVRGLQSRTGLARQLAAARVLTGDWRSAFTDLEAVQAVTAADVQRVAAETFQARNRTVGVIRTQTES